MTKPVKKKQVVELEIDDLAYEGNGVAHIDGYCVFVQNAIPGQKVKAQIFKANKSYAQAKNVEVLKRGENEVESPCKYFYHCGGCTYQNLAYSAQINYLTKQIKDIYKRIGKFRDVNFLPLISADKIFHYRNKMEFSFSHKRWLMDGIDEDKSENIALGLRPVGHYWKTIDLDDCLIAPKETKKIFDITKKYIKENKITPYNQRRHDGFLRHLAIRKGFRTNQIMLNFYTQSDKPKLLEPLSNILCGRINNLKTVVNSVASNKGGTTKSEKINILYGDGFIDEKLNNFKFRISPESFFQTNTLMAEKLYETISKFVSNSKSKILWDLFCGTGSISVFLSSKLQKIVGFELDSESIKNARFNAKMNACENLKFVQCDLKSILNNKSFNWEKLEKPDTIVIDPPRAGLTKGLVRELIEISPRNIIYVSCKPPTQVRDMRILCEEGNYNIAKVQPLDLFPQTAHVEVVTRLFK